MFPVVPNWGLFDVFFFFSVEPLCPSENFFFSLSVFERLLVFFPFFFPSFSSFFLSSPYPILSHVNQTHDERAMSEGAVCTQRRMTLLDAPVPCRTHSPHGRSDLSSASSFSSFSSSSSSSSSSSFGADERSSTEADGEGCAVPATSSTHRHAAREKAPARKSQSKKGSNGKKRAGKKKAQGKSRVEECSRAGRPRAASMSARCAAGSPPSSTSSLSSSSSSSFGSESDDTDTEESAESTFLRSFGLIPARRTASSLSQHSHGRGKRKAAPSAPVEAASESVAADGASTASNATTPQSEHEKQQGEEEVQQPQVHEEERLDSYPWESVLSGGGNGTGATPAWPQEHLDAARRWWAGAVRACTLVWVPCGGGSPFAVRSGALAPSALFARRRVPVLVVRAPTLAATHPRPVCVHVHGADEDLCACAPRLRAFAATHRTDVGALEYPGYGGYHYNSNSSQTTAAILRDLTAVVAHALVCWDGPVVLRGRQQGAVAVLHYVLAVHTPALANDRGAAALRARLAGVVADELPPVAPHLHNAAAASAADVACPVALSTPSADPAVVSATRMLALLFRRASFRWHVRCAGGDLCVDGGREEAVEEEDEDDEAREALAPIFPEAARIATVKTTPASGIAAGAGAAVAGLPELLLARVRHSDGGGNEEEEGDDGSNK